VSFKVAIPARYGSTRLPAKPLIELDGKPMIQHVYERAVRSGAEEIVIATDDERIMERAQEFGAEICLTSTEHSSGSDRLAEVAQTLAWSDDAIVVNLQGDEPLTPPVIIRQVAENLAERAHAQMATLCTPIHSAAQMYDPHTVKVVRDAEECALYFSRASIPWERDALDMESSLDTDVCYRHIGLYAYRVGYLKVFSQLAPCSLERVEKLEQLRALWHGARIHVGVAEQVPGHGVDIPEDVATVEALLAATRAETR
jgi:3-deoxy-manno-octulosonate cytidylyltransferase (CMP-KDO synthetase)